MLSLFTPAGKAAESLHECLTRVAQDMVYTTAKMYPLRATFLGLPGHDGELDTPGESQRAAQIERLKSWQQQLAILSGGVTAETPPGGPGGAGGPGGGAAPPTQKRRLFPGHAQDNRRVGTAT